LSPSLFEVGFLQCFAGWRIRAEEPCFDPGVCTMMDFGVDQRDGIHFVYVLPFSEHDALVEDTFFRAEPLPDEAYEENLAAWLARHGVERYEVIDRERGVLPMTTERIELAPSPRVIRIGLAGGLARPATGYAFLAIQRHSRTLAQRLVHGEAPAPPFPRTARTLFLDRIFLSYLARHPDRAPELFATMFERAPPDALARFLSEASSLRDDLRVMSALPALPFATEAVRSSRLWMRAR
jgi:lycopene beta-cyclase